MIFSGKLINWRGCSWQGVGLLLGLLLWSCLPSPTASQALATQLHTLKMAILVSTLTLATLDILHQHGVRVLRSDAQYAMIYAIMLIDTLEAVTVVFVSAAGNDAQRHYRDLFTAFNPNALW